MTSTLAVEIPADIKDNSHHSIRVQWRSTRPATQEEIASGRRDLDTFGYTLYEWDDTDRDGKRVTLHRFIDTVGDTVDLFATYYYTRVACGRGGWCHSYAAYYTVITNEEGEASDAVPYCDRHTDEMRRHVNDIPSLTLHLSERLNIGQH